MRAYKVSRKKSHFSFFFYFLMLATKFQSSQKRKYLANYFSFSKKLFKKCSPTKSYFAQCNLWIKNMTGQFRLQIWFRIGKFTFSLIFLDICLIFFKTIVPDFAPSYQLKRKRCLIWSTKTFLVPDLGIFSLKKSKNKK